MLFLGYLICATIIPASITQRLSKVTILTVSPASMPHAIETKGIRYVTKEPNKAFETWISLTKSIMAIAEPIIARTEMYNSECRP
jgi:ABC-type Fe2+-enterobactin transport system substrate-binding protein